MIVPTTISPIDYLKDTKEYVFYLEDFILKMDYENKRFELVTANDLSYMQSFSFINNPPEWFEVIDPGLVDWIRNLFSSPRRYTVSKDPGSSDLSKSTHIRNGCARTR